MEKARTTGKSENWYALYTKSRAEKKVAERLRRENIECYCPTQETIKRWGDRKVKLQEVLFKSYVFVLLGEKEMYRVLDIPGVVCFLYWLGRPAIIKEREITLIKSWLNHKDLAELQVSGLERGDVVYLEKGVWKDQKAIVQETGKKEVKLILPGMGFVLKAKLSNLLDQGPKYESSKKSAGGV